MRIALAVLASGFALGLSAPSYADESVPAPTRFATPQPVTASRVDTGKYCHHMIHEGALNVARCRSAQSWELTRLETQQTITELQHHSYVTPVH